MIALRAATRADIPELTALVRRCDESQRAWAGTDVPMPASEGEELEWEVRFARSAAWIQVAVEGEAILGAVAFAQATVAREDRTPIPGVGHVSAVFVDPPHWRRGIARLMLDAADAAMRAAGFSRAQLWTLDGSPAEQLYTALGWSRDGRRDTFPPMGLDTVAYVKELG
ncbi:acetyltransferase [Baekduia alba]|uniref:GNAT family N-acetyltransferase n=1 Tax=Baekduia alba TaxID=2997333 RepID=UPI002340CEC3|nr:GNAT family N-acetyltransferase [Baekduia alba]WCB93738.1 acetyltransferase [Baekduia alba]